jgi:hypothetical protein
MEGLLVSGLTLGDLPLLKSTDRRKLALAHFLWRRTKVSQGWLAAKLCLRNAAYVSQQLRRFDPKSQHRLLPPPLR